ncbi:hypothetical protein F4774DRAFT_81909 [Daldinia eschscholtzii]|nr:hypothetical protein F4774DRAFT_81909 [Daldinia eschscholtzii]
MAPHTKDADKKDDPPPYSERPTDGTVTIATSSSSSSSSQAPPPPFTPQAQPQQRQAPPPPAQPQIPRQFPPAFNMYAESRRHYRIGEHQSAPLYAVSLSPAYSSKPDVVLHSGPGENSPALAAVERVGFDRALTVTLPPIPGVGTGGGGPGGGGVGGGGGGGGRLRRTLERVETPGFLGGEAPYTFVVETGPGLRREPFEWRRSRGEAIEALGGRSSGWKLVRLRTDAPSGLGGDGDGNGGPGPVFTGGATAGDGKEVVAVWAWATMSMTKKLRFRFLGSGASGVLGERWAVMAVATALWVFERERRQREERPR